jgi:hypothetical protein
MKNRIFISDGIRFKLVAGYFLCGFIWDYFSNILSDAVFGKV